MPIGVSHNLGTGSVVLADAGGYELHRLSPIKACELADLLRSRAASGASVLLIAEDSDGAKFQIGGSAQNAIRLAWNLERNAELGWTVQRKNRFR